MQQQTPSLFFDPSSGDQDVAYHWRELDIAEFDDIQQRLVPWVLWRYPMGRKKYLSTDELLNSDQSSSDCHHWIDFKSNGGIKYYHNIDQLSMFAAVPQLPTVLHRITGQLPETSSLWVLETPIDEVMHRDNHKHICRLNWPVMNSASVETRIYHSQCHAMKIPTSQMSFNYIRYKESDCELIGSYRMTKPTILRIRSIHSMARADGPLPRYILGFTFADDILYLLDPHEHIF
jgi:hypothetical protein